MYKIIITAFGILLLMFVILTGMMKFHVGGNLYQETKAFDSQWHHSDGFDADLMQIAFDEQNHAVLTKYITERELNGRNLCFVTRNVVFSIYLNETQIYDFHPELGGIYGKYYGDYLHMVSVPSFEGTRQLRIECDALLVNSWTGFDNMIVQDSGVYVQTVLRENMFGFIVCLTAFLFGTAIFLASLIFRNIYANNLETMTLGMVTMVLSLWSNSQNRVFPLINGNFAAAHVLDYLALMVMPVPILIFVSLVTNQTDKKAIQVFLGLSVMNVLLQFGTVLTGIGDYHDVLRISHILIVSGIGLVIYLIAVSGKKQKLEQNQRFYLVIGLGLVILGGILDMVRYYLFHAKDSSALSRIGLILFVMMLSVYEFRELITLHIRSSEAEMMHKLAVTDSLTGMKNRTAFTEYEQFLSEQNSGVCLFIHLDVNHLKTVNDTYGHAAGDKHILAAAGVITGSFGEKGICFRVGGDEFFVIMEGKNCLNDYEAAKKKFLQMQAEYNQNQNPPVPLAIAHGCAEYSYSLHNPEAAERLADKRMYENKRSMKKST